MASTTTVGPALREWRVRRRKTQLELALDAGISTRHLSFVETGRSKPGRDLLLKILEQLDLPLREQNRLLLTAGHAPAFAERPLGAPELAPVRKALDLILDGHEPYPAVAFDRSWNLVAANRPMVALGSQVDVDPALLEPPVNILRLGLHPRGLGPTVLNLAQWHGLFRDRLARQVEVTGDPALAELLAEISAYPVPDAPDDGDPLTQVRVRAPDGTELAFFGMFAIFDTPFEVTTSELAIELLFPADARTARALAG